ncbi:UNVERIFIED_CONTAM: hypothetical protein H355_007076 [Colinus virginianus]|nr:hypothetical protein H355_007076 [Colinus virginianus]
MVQLLCWLLTGSPRAAGLAGLGYKTEPRQAAGSQAERILQPAKDLHSPCRLLPCGFFFLEYRPDLGSKMCKGLAALPATCLKSAKDMKHRLGVLLQKSDSCDYGSSQGKKEKVSPSQSEENIEFWVSCEDYKKTKSPAKLSPKARKIYDEFISVQATKEVNLDSYTREKTSHNILEPTLSCFDEAQRKIFTLMEKDSYRRFLKSPYYLDLVSPPRAGCGPENCKRTHAHGLDYNSNIISQCA